MRKQILQKAFDQFMKYGIRDMSVQKLVASLGISTKTMYRYYKNKEELLEEVLKLYYARQYRLLEDLEADQKVVSLFIDIWYTAIEREYSVNNIFFHDLHYYYPELDRKLETSIGLEFWKRFEQIIQKGIREGVFRDGIHPELALEGLGVLYNAVGRTEKYERFHQPPFEIFLNSIALYIRGLCTQKGLQEFDAHIATLKPFGNIKDGKV